MNEILAKLIAADPVLKGFTPETLCDAAKYRISCTRKNSTGLSDLEHARVGGWIEEWGESVEDRAVYGNPDFFPDGSAYRQVDGDWRVIPHRPQLVPLAEFGEFVLRKMEESRSDEVLLDEIAAESLRLKLAKVDPEGVFTRTTPQA